MSRLSSRGREWQRLRLSILERDGYVCGYGCGREADQVDHIISKQECEARGIESDDETNLIAACKQCNGRKGSKPMIRGNYVNKKWLSNV